jgi:hypothetical protein
VSVRLQGDDSDESAPRIAWLSKAALQLHAVLLLGLTGCAVATWIELRRGLQGRQLAWVYVFEWPLFAVLGTYLWWRLLHADIDEGAGAARSGKNTASAKQAAGPSTGAAEQDDPELVAWQAYLARLHAVDPPGKPPARK